MLLDTIATFGRENIKAKLITFSSVLVENISLSSLIRVAGDTSCEMTLSVGRLRTFPEVTSGFFRKANDWCDDALLDTEGDLEKDIRFSSDVSISESFYKYKKNWTIECTLMKKFEYTLIDWSFTNDGFTVAKGERDDDSVEILLFSSFNVS